MATNGHDAICQRGTCAELPQHKGGEHLDPNSKMWDGPETTVNALGDSYARIGAKALRRLATDENRHEVDVAVYEMAREILRLKDQVAAVQVDRDRQVRAAMRRADDCEAHGEDIVQLDKQVHYFDQLAERNDRGRVALLQMLLAIQRSVDEMNARVKLGRPLPSAEDLIEALADMAKKASAAHGRAWKS